MTSEPRRLDLKLSLSSALSRKGFAIIAIPTVFSVSFILVLKLLLNEAQNQADREARSKQVIANANGLGSAVISAVTERYLTRFSGPDHSEAKFAETARVVKDRFQELKTSVPPGTRQAELVDRIGTQLTAALEILEQQSLARTQGMSVQSIHALMHTRKRMQDIYAKITADSVALVEAEREKQSSQPISYKRYRQIIDLSLLLAVVLDAGLALALMMYFSSDITSRLTVLMDNAARLVDERALNPIVTGNDEISQLDRVIHDTAKKLAEANRRERELLERVKSIVETIPLGLIVVDSQGAIVSMSPSAERLFEHPAAEVEGKQIAELFSMRASESEESLAEKVLLADKTVPRELTARRSSGDTFPCEILGTAYTTSTIEGRLLVVTDISERYRVEQLKQSFVSLVSHELRSPLTSVQVCLKMLLRQFFGPLNEEGKRHVELAEKSVQRLIALVNEILDVERLESGNIAISPEVVTMSEIIELATGSVSALSQSADISVECSHAEFSLTADKNRMVQVLVNLLSNAVKFSPRGSSIELLAEKIDNEVEIRVKDQGRGIPQEHRDQIFKRFHQVKTSDATEKGGTGLGLAICRAIVEAHNGQIGVDSTVGHGSTFWIKLPANGQSENGC